MSTDALRRAFKAGWGRFDSSAEFDEKRCDAEFDKWYCDEIQKFSPIGLLYGREEYGEQPDGRPLRKT